MDAVAPRVLFDKMLDYWKKEIHVSDKTANDWLCAAFDYERYFYALEQIRLEFGDLTDRKVAEIGCGWGTFLSLLAREGAVLQACEIAPVHVEIAQMRVPSARVILGDARELRGFDSGQFDFVVEHDVFEHIGDPADGIGPIGRSYVDKLANLTELRRILRPGGRGFLSTPNFQFPYDGEVHLWFVHWLPHEYQMRYLSNHQLNSDRYWLCTWDQVQKLFAEAGLIIEKVITPPHNALSLRNSIMSFLNRDPQFKKGFAEILLELMLNRPEYMPSWMVFFKKG